MSKVDHFAVQATVSVGSSSPSEPVVSRRVPFFDRNELRTEQCREGVAFMLEQTPYLPDMYGIERHTSLLAKWFRCVLVSAAPAWNAICPGAQVRKLMFFLRRGAKLVWPGCVFNGWRCCQMSVDLVWCRAVLLHARFEEAFVVFLLEQHKKVVRSWLRADWAAELRRVSEVAQLAAERGQLRVIYESARSL